MTVSGCTNGILGGTFTFLQNVSWCIRGNNTRGFVSQIVFWTSRCHLRTYSLIVSIFGRWMHCISHQWLGHWKTCSSFISVRNTCSPTHLTIFVISTWRVSPLNICNVFFHQFIICKHDNKLCSSFWCLLLIIWSFSLICSVCLPYGMQDVNGWPTPTPQCVWAERQSHKGLEGERGDRLSHPDAANLLPASHVNRYAIVWSIACFAWTETLARR